MASPANPAREELLADVMSVQDDTCASDRRRGHRCSVYISSASQVRSSSAVGANWSWPSAFSRTPTLRNAMEAIFGKALITIGGNIGNAPWLPLATSE